MTSIIPAGDVAVARSTVATRWCRTCDKRRTIGVAGTCLVCAQLPGSLPGDPCSLCLGDGRIDGVDDAPPSCPACDGTGKVPAVVRR